MLLLAADTSGKHGSMALARCDPYDTCDLIEAVSLAGGTFSAQLVPQIAGLLAKHGFNKQDIGAFAVTSGPGSFTGLRVGLAAIKALAEVLAKPIAAVSLLEAIAVSARLQGKVIALLDAGRGEIYAGEYEVSGPLARVVSERLLTLTDLLEAAAGSVVLSADPGVADSVRNAGTEVMEIELPGIKTIACLGWRKILAGETISPEELDANYIRGSTQVFTKRGP